MRIASQIHQASRVSVIFFIMRSMRGDSHGCLAARAKKTAIFAVLFPLGVTTRYEEARNCEAYHGIVKSKGPKEKKPESAKYKLISGLYLSIVLQCILLVFLV